MPMRLKLPEPLFTEQTLNSVGGDALKGKQYFARDLAEAATSEASIAQLRTAHDRMREGFYAVLNALRTPDPTLTPEAHYVETKKQSDRWIDQCVGACASARQSAENTLSALNNDIDKRLEIRDSARASEIRSYFGALKKSERIPAALAAIERSDKETIGAILGAPTYLSGITESERAVLWNAHAEKHAGDLLKRKKITEKALAINDLSFNQALVALGAIFPKQKVDGIVNKTNIAARARSAITVSI